MGFFNKFPYTDFHELNLDWVLKMLKELDQEWDEFKVLNTITLAGTWDISKNYPKYAIVEDSGNGYLSIKPVPPGIAISNLDYWLPVGTYASAISALNTRMNTAESNITTLQNNVSTLNGTVSGHTTQINNLSNKLDVNNILKGQIVMIGDSYLEGWTPDGDVTSWGVHLKNILNKPDDQIFAKGGAGFCNTVDSVNFVTLLDDANASAAVDNDKVTLVLFGGGYNDTGYTAAQILTALQSASSKISTYFPNAAAAFAYMPWDRNSGSRQTYQKLYAPARYANAFKQVNIAFFENIYKSLQAVEGLFSSDNKHPNGEGQKAIAKAIYETLLGTYSPCTAESAAVSGENNIFVSGDENTYNVLFYAQKMFTVSYSTFVCNGATKAAELDISQFGIKPGTQYFKSQIRGFIEGYISGNNRYVDVTYDVSLTADGKLEFYPWAVNLTHDNYLTFESVSHVYVYPGNILIPKIYT